MPVTEWDLIKGGLTDFKLDNLNITKHAIQRCKERGIPLEDLHKKKGPAVLKGNTVVTAYSKIPISKYMPSSIPIDKPIISNMFINEVVQTENNKEYMVEVDCSHEIAPYIIGKEGNHLKSLIRLIKDNKGTIEWVNLKNKFIIRSKKEVDCVFMKKYIEGLISLFKKGEHGCGLPKFIKIIQNIDEETAKNIITNNSLNKNVVIVSRGKNLYIIAQKQKHLEKIIKILNNDKPIEVKKEELIEVKKKELIEVKKEEIIEVKKEEPKKNKRKKWSKVKVKSDDKTNIFSIQQEILELKNRLLELETKVTNIIKEKNTVKNVI